MDISSLLMIEKAVQMLWQAVQLEKQRWFNIFRQDVNQYRFSRFSERIETPVECSHCKRKGHYYAECRRRLKTCFICGEASHLLRACPYRVKSHGKTKLVQSSSESVAVKQDDAAAGQIEETSLSRNVKGLCAHSARQEHTNGERDRGSAIAVVQDKVLSNNNTSRKINVCKKEQLTEVRPIPIVETSCRVGSTAAGRLVEVGRKEYTVLSASHENTSAALDSLFASSTDCTEHRTGRSDSMAILDDFSKIEMKPEEDVSLYQYRIENAYKKRYPCNEVNTSHLLLQKFMDTCPRKVKKYIKRYQAAKREEGHQLKWRHIGRVLKKYQEESSSPGSSYSAD